MLTSLRARLILIVGIATAALLLLIGVGLLLGANQMRGIEALEERIVPRLEFGPKLVAQFEKLRQELRDAVAASDKSALDATQEAKEELFDLIAGSGVVLSSADAASLRWAVQAYYEKTYDVSQRLIAGETGEAVVDEMAEMQKRYEKALGVVTRVSTFERGELSGSFESLRNGIQEAAQFRMLIGGLGFLLILGTSFFASRHILKSVDGLSKGLGRFSTGNFAEPIDVLAEDELGKVAKEANRMASSLQLLGEQRDRNDWLREGSGGLAEKLRGDLAPDTVSRSALWFLARKIHAHAAALYLNENGTLVLHSHYAGEHTDLASNKPHPSFQIGEGLVGQAAQHDELLVIEEPPPSYLKVRSGLGEAPPRSLVLLPLFRLEKVVAVLEFALFVELSGKEREFLLSIREMLLSAIDVAVARAAQQALLERTQRQAELLSAQEEELRLSNQELQSQQEELRRANDELEQQRQTLRQQNDELEVARERVQQKVVELDKASTYKSQFLSNMSHELRTPLNSMLLLSHLLSENESGNLGPKQVEHAKTIHSAGQDLLALINQVLDLAKIESGKQEVHFEAVELRQFILYARRVFEPLAADKGLTLTLEIAPHMPETIETDPQRMERIITNLLGNAVKFTEQGEVAFRIGRPGPDARIRRGDLSLEDAVTFTVSDTGVGIDPEAHQRIFAPFEQVESKTNRRYSGTGLGLAIALESATLLGGELQLESSPGKGSTFICYLPERAKAVVSRPQPKKKTERPLEPSAVADDRSTIKIGHPHILVIEDDPVFAERLVDIIHVRNFKVVVANTGEEGLRLSRELTPVGIILDVKLPDIDGWTVMDQLRKDPVTRSIPVHFVSGVDAPERGLSLGAVGYVTKPATHDELATAVHAVTPQKEASARILVIEDNAREGASIVALLEKENLEAKHVQSALEALSVLQKEKFGCVILDLGLPDMDGLAVLEALRKHPGGNIPRVVIHTGRALTKKETQELETYAEAVIMKDGRSAERLLDEMRLFVRHLQEKLPRKDQLEVNPSSHQPVGDISLNGVKILLAEDDMRTVYAISALLRGKGAEVLVADNGREAVEVLQHNPSVHVVLMDVMMPEMDGYEAMRLIRKEARFSKLPVIALTAKAMKGERERCVEAGASEYLTKPVDIKQLLATVHSFVQSGSRAS